ncbi:methyl-accepting chemotaxis protein [Synechocystis sp. PCC 7509]|uniref:methyl-accepting chemotaxis protein n=1 Tax=Synechocystis sp. PCC 7509 TaxID=927677 RepID=UPI0002AC4DF4
MTQTSPKPSDRNIANGHNQADGDTEVSGFFKSAFPSPTTELSTSSPQSAPARKSTVRQMPQEMKSFSWWQRLGLRPKLTLGAIALGVIPLALLGTIAYNVADREIVNQLNQTKEAKAVDLANQMEVFLLERSADALSIADLRIVANPKGRATATAKEKQEQLDSIVKNSGFYDSIAVSDLQGNILLQSSGEPVATLSDKDYFQEVIKTKKVAITDPRPSVVTKKLSFFVAAPIFDSASGKFIGVVRTRTPGEKITKLLENFARNNNKYYVLGAEGEVILANEPERIGRDAKADFPNLAKLQAAKKTGTALGNDAVNKDEELIGYTPFEKFEGVPELGWSAVVSEKSDSAYAAQYVLIWALGLGTLATALLVGALAAYVARLATRPILEATSTVEKLGRGEFDNRVEVTGGDEIAVLGSNINKMADQVQILLRQQELESEQARLFADVASSRADNVQDVEGVFNQALAGAKDILQADRVVVYRFKPDFSGYIANESVSPGFPQALNDKIEDPCISDELIEAYKQGRVVPTSNVFEAGFHPDHLALMERLQIMANLVTPIINNNELYGLLIAHHCTAPHDWQQTEITFLTQMSERLGVILGRVSFLEQKEAEATRSALLKDITVSIGQSLSPEDIFNQAVQQARRAINSDRVVIYSFNDKWQGTVTAESVGEGWPKAMGAKIDDPCFADKYTERYKAGRVQATNNIYKAGLTDCHIKQLSIFGVQANLVAPILRGGQLLGLLIAHQCSAPRNWEQGEIDLFSQLATQVGFALDRANLLEQQRAAKEFLQRRALELLIEVDPLSRGDLTIRANVTEDEIGTVADSYNATIGSLRKIVTQVQLAAIQVAATTTDNQGSVQGLSFEALRQTKEIAGALEELALMTTSIRAVAANASQAEAAVKRATDTVREGDSAMNRTVDGILAIRETVAETSKKVKRLGESSQKISKVVNLIGSFADQTNLLALNASIEAAHAGEQGRGFAVVADEVRVLARQSAAATAEIEALVKDIQTETNEVVAAMEAGTEQVVTGTRLVDETRQSLNKITAVSTEISQLVAAIALAAVAQSKASDSVTHTMTDVATIAGTTSTEASNVSASFTELLAVAQDLSASVGQFKVK